MHRIYLGMTGQDVKTASPTILLTCETQTARKRGIELIEKSSILHRYPGVKFVSSRGPPPLLPIRIWIGMSLSFVAGQPLSRNTYLYWNTVMLTFLYYSLYSRFTNESTMCKLDRSHWNQSNPKVILFGNKLEIQTRMHTLYIKLSWMNAASNTLNWVQRLNTSRNTYIQCSRLETTLFTG